MLCYQSRNIFCLLDIVFHHESRERLGLAVISTEAGSLEVHWMQNDCG